MAKMEERLETASTGDAMATMQSLRETEPSTSPDSSHLVPTAEKPDQTSQRQNKTANAYLQFLYQWGLEIAALALSLLGFGLMTYVLYQSAGKPISKWTKSYISLNTTVSILAGTSRACLAFAISICLSQGKWNWLSRSAQPLVDFDRFDAASRGAWGSVRLLRSCVRRPHWVAIGALTAIALLAFEPFTQAVLTLEGKEVTLNHKDYAKIVRSSNNSINSLGNFPTIGRSVHLDGASWNGDLGILGVATFPGPNNTTMNYTFWRVSSDIQEDMGMKAAIWNGFSPFTATQNIRPAFACATGNCTWAKFTSIAICSECLDISQHVTKSSGPVTFPKSIKATGPDYKSWILEPGEKPPDVSNPGPYLDWNSGRNFTFIKYMVPELDLSLSNYNGSRQCSSLTQRCPDTYLSARITTNPGQTLTFGNLSTMLMAIQYLAANESWLENRTTWEETKVTAQECALSFCVNEYQDIISQGVFQETIVSSWTDRIPESYSTSDKDVEAFMKYTNYSLDMGIMLVDLSDLQIRIPDKDYKRHATVLRQQIFNITQPTIIGLHNILSDGFGGFRDVGTLDNLDWNYTSITSKKLLYPALGVDQPTAGLMSGLGRSSDIPTTLDNVALSLTKWIRDRELDTSPMFGNATNMVVITCVRWNFLLFPGISLITGIVFAVLCIWETQQLKKPALKDSILATLACAPNEDLRLCLKQAAANGNLQTLGRELKVRWEEDDEFGQLKEKKDEDAGVR